MGRNKKIIIISAAAALLVLGVLSFMYIWSGNINSRFFGGNIEKPQQAQESDKSDKTGETAVVEEAEKKADEAVPGVADGENPVPEQSNNSQTDENKTTEDKQEKKEQKNIKVKAVYLTGVSAGSSKVLDHFIKLVNTTELNALVIDIKEAGVVNYESNVPEVRDNKLYTKYYDADSVIKKLHDNNIYVIGRIVCFRDNGLASKRQDLAIKRPDGSLWREGKLGAWTNPYMEETWKYNIDIAKEAIDKGFDEIQFDYVRFPTAKKSEISYGSNVPSKVDAISKFLKTAKKELGDGKGTVVSADVFGIICESVRDGQAIGQDLEKVGMHIDYISPMVYPSHYANASPRGMMGNGYGQKVNGVLFTAPDLKPYEVVYNTLVKCKNRISQVAGYNAKVRPYLQDFTATYLPKGYYQEYGAQQVRQQIKAVYDAGYDEWILWDGRNTYSEAVFEKE